MASATFTSETDSGWQQVDFASPVAIAPKTTYIASYFAPQGNYAVDTGSQPGGLGVGVDNPPLHAVANSVSPNGVFLPLSASGFPSQSSTNGANYWVDVVFRQSLGPDTNGPTVVAVSPADGAVGVSLGTALMVRFSQSMNAATVNGSTITLQDAQNHVVAATVSYNAATFAAVLTPASRLATSTRYTVRVSTGAKDVAGNALANTFTAAFTTTDQAVHSIWSASAVPTHPTYDIKDVNSYKFGVKFKSDIDGYVMGVRFYKGPNNSGTHIGNLWTSDGVNLASAIFTGETGEGWQEVSFATPVAITAGTIYVASYFDPSGGYSADLAGEPGGLVAGVDNSPLHALADSTEPNGVLVDSASSAFPANSGNGVNYWVDVVFEQPVRP